MGEKQIDFNTPLLSVRRNASRIDSKPEARSSSGYFIPFTWEQSPGKPKRALGSMTGDDRLLRGEEEEEDSDSELCSVNESFSDCSVSSCGGRSSGFDDVKNKEGVSKSLEMQELIMERFLSASVATATGSLEVPMPKEAQGSDHGESRRTRVPLPFQHRPVEFCKLPNYDREEIESDEGHKGFGHFARACGLIPRCLLLNPLPGMKVRAADEESWDEQLEEGSKVTSESYQLTNWSDSQTLDGSSHRHSPRSPFHERKGSVKVDNRELKGRKTISFDWFDTSEKFSKIRPILASPSMDRTPSSISGSVEAAVDTPVLENCVEDEMKLKNFEPERSNCGNDDQLVSQADDVKEKNDAGLELALLPPPSLKSPSESWLRRTLPSVSSKTIYHSPYWLFKSSKGNNLHGHHPKIS